MNMVRADVAKLSIYHLTGFVPLKANSSLPCHLHGLCPQLSESSSGSRGLRIVPTLVIMTFYLRKQLKRNRTERETQRSMLKPED